MSKYDSLRHFLEQIQASISEKTMTFREIEEMVVPR